jgi:alginate O-acetyltransferase complex protein AlgI
LGKLLKKLPPLAHIYSLIIVGFGWMIFFHSDLSLIAQYAKQLVGIGTAFAASGTGYKLLSLLPFIAVCALACTPYPKQMFERLCTRFPKLNAAKPLLLWGLFLVCVAYMVDNSFSPFLYYIF